MKKKTAIKWIDRSLVASPCYIGLCLNKKDFKAEMKRLRVSVSDEWIPKDKQGRVHFFISKNGKKTAIVCIRRNGKPVEIVGLLIHEAVHIWQNIKEDINENHPSSEFEAYSIQAIAQRLIDAAGGRKE